MRRSSVNLPRFASMVVLPNMTSKSVAGLCAIKPRSAGYKTSSSWSAINIAKV